MTYNTSARRANVRPPEPVILPRIDYARAVADALEPRGLGRTAALIAVSDSEEDIELDRVSGIPADRAAYSVFVATQIRSVA